MGEKKVLENQWNQDTVQTSEKGCLGLHGTGAERICMFKIDQGPQRESSKWGKYMHVSGTEEFGFKHLPAFNPHQLEKVNQNVPIL